MIYRALGPLCVHRDSNGAPAYATAYVLDWQPPRLDSLGRRKSDSHARPAGPPVALAVGFLRRAARCGLQDACRLDGGSTFDWRVSLLGAVPRSAALTYLEQT